MKRYLFTITLSGLGNDASEAWEEAVEAFNLDAGVTPDETEYTVEDLKEN